jgi:hypothetical protein
MGEESMASVGRPKAAAVTFCETRTIWVLPGMVQALSHEIVHVIQGCPSIKMPNGEEWQHPYFDDEQNYWGPWIDAVNSCAGIR